jgi:hypothetical protein
MLADRPVKNPCGLPFVLPSTDRIGPVRLLPRWVVLAGYLNAKHVDWNSWLSTRRGKLLHDYANENSC